MATAVAPHQQSTNPDLIEEKSKLQANLNTPDDSSTRAPSDIDSKSIQEGTSTPAVPAETLPSEPIGPVKAPFPFPLPACKPQHTPELTADQQAKYDEVYKTASAWTEIPTTSGRNPKTEPITEEERMWLTKECLLRYLRATKWHVPEACKRLLTTLIWRREYGTVNFTADYISPENETGKQIILGFDNDARPCLYLNPSKQNTAKSDRQLHHLVFMLERVIDLMPPGQETTALLINFKESSSGSNPSVGQGKQTLNILQGHYPERLGRALISDLPWYVTTFFKFISPFIDPVTKTKMKFNEPLSDHVPPAQLHKAYGGEADFVYDHSIYWSALNSLCDARRTEYRDRWEARGKKVGESEFYLRGGEEGIQRDGNNVTDGVTLEQKLEATNLSA